VRSPRTGICPKGEGGGQHEGEPDASVPGRCAGYGILGTDADRGMPLAEKEMCPRSMRWPSRQPGPNSNVSATTGSCAAGPVKGRACPTDGRRRHPRSCTTARASWNGDGIGHGHGAPGVGRGAGRPSQVSASRPWPHLDRSWLHPDRVVLQPRRVACRGRNAGP
jgi:hypothetical protein